MLNVLKKITLLQIIGLAAGLIIATAILIKQAPIIFSGPGFGQPGQSNQLNAGLAEGTLVKSDGEDKVYLIQNGFKSWITTAAAFTRQGFNWGHIAVMPATELRVYPEGEPVTETSKIVLPGEAAILPDLVPLALQDLRFATVNGRQVLRFTSTFWNQGGGPMELVNNTQVRQQTAGDAYFDTYQRLSVPRGLAREIFVGSIYWHAMHDHYHYVDFGDYTLSFLDGDGKSSPVPPAAFKKTTFCLRDNWRVASLPGSPTRQVFTGCTGARQGVSVGWTDVYPSTLPDQYIDVNDLPAGRYQLSFVVDPRVNFTEARQDNNTSVVILDLNVASGQVKVLATGMPFSSTANNYQDGLLVKATGDDKVYVMRDNKKMYLPSLTASHPHEPVYDLPGSVMENLPRVSIVQVEGSDHLYYLNPFGFKRRILNMDVFNSYGWIQSDIVQITPGELADLADTPLVMRVKDGSVYSLADKKYLGTLSSLSKPGFDPYSIQGINETDFTAYGLSPVTPERPPQAVRSVEVVAENLNVPWDLVFLPDGDLLVTERPGTLKRLGKNPATITVPSVNSFGEGGLMGIALHPDFAANQLVYLYYTARADGTKNRVVRFKLENNQLIQDKIIIDNIPSALYHDGGQIAFGPDGMLYLTTGDSEKPQLAQDLNSLAGKTLRLTADGNIPADNPFGSAVWSYGHRNAQGIAWDSAGRLWQTEHGRSGALSGFDELNKIAKGKNYGWPNIQGSERAANLETPIINSTAAETWAPSGLAFVNGKLYFAGLRGATLYQAEVDEQGNAVNLKKYFAGIYGRLRAVVLGPDGYLYFTTSNRDGRGTVRSGDDKILKIHPDYFK